MTESVLRNISPDALTGIILSLDGMADTVVLLNGPMGCKFYHSTTSQYLTPRPPLYLPSSDGKSKVAVHYNFLNHWFFRQSRVPCTYLDGVDYIYGTAEKVKEGLSYLREHVDFQLLIIINSPGASLIGDNLLEVVGETLPDRRHILIESPGYSEGFSRGYETACKELIGQLDDSFFQVRTVGSGRPVRQDRPGKKRKCVNLLGLSLWDRYSEGDIRELRRLFALCDIDVGCCLFAGNTMEELRSLLDADLNVVLYPERAALAAQNLQKRFGMPYVICPSLPVGFDATQQLVADVCQRLGADASAAFQDIEKARAVAWYHLDNLHQMNGMPTGVRYAVEGTVSQVYAYHCFFSDYLGMIPDCLEVTDGAPSLSVKDQQIFLQQENKRLKLRQDILDTDAELVFGEANTIALIMMRTDAFCGIEISRPTMGYVDVLSKTQFGVQGTLFLIEQVINGLVREL